MKDQSSEYDSVIDINKGAWVPNRSLIVSRIFSVNLIEEKRMRK